MNTKTITWQKLLTTEKDNSTEWEIFITWILILIFCINFWIWLIFAILEIIALFR